MFDQKLRLLQLFAGEGTPGEGGAGAAAETGATGADAGHQRLRAPGAPEAQIPKNPAPQPEPLSEGLSRTQTVSGENLREAPSGRMTWEQILQDPEYNARMQSIIRSRVREEGKNRAAMEALAPALKHLAKQHGMDPEQLDHAALAKAITGEGVSPVSRQEQLREHIRSLRRQEQAMQAVVPGFDLRREMANPLFARLTGPGVGMGVEDAFYAVHRKAMQAQSMQVAAQQASRMISNAIRSGSHRPEESGTTAQASSVSRFDYRNATPEQRKALKDAIYRAGAEGRKIYPG